MIKYFHNFTFQSLILKMDPRNKIEIDKFEICKEVFTSIMLKNKHLKNCHFENQIIQNHKCTTSCVKTFSTSNK